MHTCTASVSSHAISAAAARIIAPSPPPPQHHRRLGRRRRRITSLRDKADSCRRPAWACMLAAISRGCEYTKTIVVNVQAYPTLSVYLYESGNKIVL